MSLSPDRLIGKNCIVTGGAGSMGFDVSARFASYGARTFLVDYSDVVTEKAAELRAKGYEAYGYQLDVTDHDAVIACFAGIIEKYGPVFSLSLCHGVGGNYSFEDTTPAIWQRVFGVNFFGTVNCIQGVIGSMRKQHEGKIVILSSKTGKTGSKLMTVYGSSKGALVTLTQSLAQEYAKDNININAVCPDIIAGTAIWENQVCPNYMKELHLSKEEVVKMYTDKVPLGHFARMEDVTDAIAYLTISADDSTGQSLNVTGGRFMH